MELSNPKQEVSYRFIADNKKNTQGKVKIYLRFYRSGIKIKDYNTGIRVLKSTYDAEKEYIIRYSAKDSEAALNNVKINHMKSLLHRMDAEAFVQGRTNDLDDYLRVLNIQVVSVDFVGFVNKNNNYEYNKDIIKYDTWRRHRSSLNRFIEYWGSDHILISDITIDKIREYDAYWKQKGKKRNTIVGYHKDIKKQLGAAVKKNIIIKNPYDDFKFSYVPGDREALDIDEVNKLYKLYQSNTLTENLHEVLRRFLFSCITGLRISDTHVVKREMITNNVLKFTPQKGRSFAKIIKLPLPAKALELIEGRHGLLFKNTSDKHINFLLKVLGPKAGIEKELSYHCARDTFGTIFMEMGGDIKTLKELMGHTDIKTTEIYLKMSDKRKVNLMNNFDKIFE